MKVRSNLKARIERRRQKMAATRARIRALDINERDKDWALMVACAWGLA